MGFAKFKVFPGGSPIEEASRAAKGYAMAAYSFDKLGDETDRFGATTETWELRGLRMQDVRALTKDPLVCRMVEALAAGDLVIANAVWGEITVEANLKAAEKAQAEGKRNPWGRP